MTTARLALTREQILAYRRTVGALDERLPPGPASLGRAAWAGLQDSVPRAAVISLHARVHGTGPDTWEDPSLLQLWGPRFSVYVVAARDLAAFSVGRLPDDVLGRRRAEDLASRLHAFLDGRRMAYGEAGRGLGVHPNSLRYAAATGTVLIRWDGARQVMVWTAPPPDVDPRQARLELARRYLHVFGPATPAGFAQWAGIRPRSAGRAAFEALVGLVDAGPDAGRRGVDPEARRADDPRRRPVPSVRAAAPERRRLHAFAGGRIGSCWSLIRTTVARSGPPASGLAPSSSRARSSGPGDAHRPRSRSSRGDRSRSRSARQSRPRRRPCRSQVSATASRSAGTTEHGTGQ